MEINNDIYSVESRTVLAKMTFRLFELWNIPAADQLELLGIKPDKRYLLSKYKAGKPLPSSRDTIDRVGWLMSIHKDLGLLYPYNDDVRYSWVNRRNKVFDSLRPLDVMKEQGFIGIARVARYLEFCRGQ